MRLCLVCVWSLCLSESFYVCVSVVGLSVSQLTDNHNCWYSHPGGDYRKTYLWAGLSAGLSSAAVLGELDPPASCASRLGLAAATTWIFGVLDGAMNSRIDTKIGGASFPVEGGGGRMKE